MQPRTSLNYRPPELDVKDPNWSAEVDSWSIGCVLAEMYSGKADLYAGSLSAEAALSVAGNQSGRANNKKKEKKQVQPPKAVSFPSSAAAAAQASTNGSDDEEEDDEDGDYYQGGGGDLNRDAEEAAAFARAPAFAEIGRGPLFRAESAFEHLAMVERTVGKLPQRLYSVSNIFIRFWCSSLRPTEADHIATSIPTHKNIKNLRTPCFAALADGGAAEARRGRQREAARRLRGAVAGAGAGDQPLSPRRRPREAQEDGAAAARRR